MAAMHGAPLIGCPKLPVVSLCFPGAQLWRGCVLLLAGTAKSSKWDSVPGGRGRWSMYRHLLLLKKLSSGCDLTLLVSRLVCFSCSSHFCSGMKSLMNIGTLMVFPGRAETFPGESECLYKALVLTIWIFTKDERWKELSMISDNRDLR